MRYFWISLLTGLLLPLLFSTPTFATEFARSFQSEITVNQDTSLTIKETIIYETDQDKHLFIENIFPFAVALGVVQKITRDMEALKIDPPSYMSNIPAGMAFNSWVSDFTTQATSSMSYNPSSSSRSGGSGFSSGSSGGGGGGGGGGSW